MREWRRQEFLKDRNKILIIAEQKYYALFEITELLNILGVKQKYKLKMNC
jgi:hypothetical protein